MSTPPTTGPRRRRHVAALVMTAVLAGPLAACGDDQEPAPTGAEQVPALATQLDRIDGALAARRFPRARNLLERLTQQVIDARAAGELDAETADRILASASRLSAALPEPKPSAPPTTSAPPPADDDDDDGNGNGDGSGGGNGGGNGGDDNDDEAKKNKQNEADKQAEEARKKAEEARKKRQGNKKGN